MARLLAVVREPVLGNQIRAAATEAGLEPWIVEAFEAFETHTGDVWDFWVVDLHLPDLPEATWLQEFAYIPPVVVLAGYAQSEKIARWLRAGAHAFCPKPLHKDLFLVSLELARRTHQVQTLYRQVAITLAHHVNNLLTLPLGMGRSFWKRWEAGEWVDEEEWEGYFVRVMKNLEKIHAVIRALLEVEAIEPTTYWGREQMLNLEQRLQKTFEEIDARWRQHESSS